MESVQEVHNEQSEPLAILVAEDESDIAEPIRDVLSEEGHQVSLAFDGAQAMRALQSRRFDLVISDIRLPHVDGLSILHWIQTKSPTTPVILMTAYGSIPEAVSAVQDQAFHYLAKPFDLEKLLALVGEIADQRATNRMFHASPPDGIAKIVGNCVQMTALKQQLQVIANVNAAVLIHGESGTGKELVARAIHDASSRNGGPFVAINCAAFPETLFEAELFGHERGAFSGASNRREGRFRAADGGTLFLDEVFELSPSSQAKLLRVLQEGTFQPLGSDTEVSVDVRIISATNADLRGSVVSGKFRSDLFYRLKVLELRVPPLRDRKEDLPFLVGHLIRKATKTGNAPKISARAWAALRNYEYPGNVRELEHALRHASVLSQGKKIDVVHLPNEFREQNTKVVVQPTADLSTAIADFEKQYLLQILEETKWSRCKAAEKLGISRKNLWEKLKKHNIGTNRYPTVTPPLPNGNTQL